MRDLREASQLGGVARALIVAAALGVAGALALYLALRPPTPLAVPARGVVLRGVHLVNPGEEPLRDRTIRITGARIDSISAASPDAAEDPYAGSYVLPGLIDLHVHHPIARLGTDIELFGLLHLLHDVTTVRDCGSIDGSILTTRERVAAGALAGPASSPAGPPADLLIFERDPSRDASALASLRAVVSDGRLYPRGVLEEAVARYRAHHESWLVERITGWLFALFAGA